MEAQHDGAQTIRTRWTTSKASCPRIEHRSERPSLEFLLIWLINYEATNIVTLCVQLIQQNFSTGDQVYKTQNILMGALRIIFWFSSVCFYERIFQICGLIVIFCKILLRNILVMKSPSIVLLSLWTQYNIF